MKDKLLSELEKTMYPKDKENNTNTRLTVVHDPSPKRENNNLKQNNYEK